jgi:glycosyltransferase involved in cell wall biosynthesis
LHYGGPGTSAYRFYAKSNPAQFAVTLAHGYAAQDRYPIFVDQHYIGDGNGRVWQQYQFIRRGVAWIRRNWKQFDVLHATTGFESSVTPAHTADRLGLPAIVQIAAHRSDLALQGKVSIGRLLGVVARRRRRIAEISGVIATSSCIERELLECGVPARKIARIPYAVDTDQFHPVADDARRQALRQELGWLNLPTIVFSGAVIPRKRPLALVEAVALLNQRGIPCQAVLLGPVTDAPDYVESIRQRIGELGIERQIVLAGFSTNVAPVYQASDVFCLPSKNEGLPNAMLEAMASGLPAVVTPISGCTDVVDDGRNSRIVEGSPESLAEAIGTYLNDSVLRQAHGRAIRQLILERYDHQVVLKMHEELYRRVILGAPLA